MTADTPTPAPSPEVASATRDAPLTDPFAVTVLSGTLDQQLKVALRGHPAGEDALNLIAALRRCINGYDAERDRLKGLLAIEESHADALASRLSRETARARSALALVEEMARDLVALGSGLPGDDRLQFDLLMAQRHAEAAAIREEGNDG